LKSFPHKPQQEPLKSECTAVAFSIPVLYRKTFDIHRKRTASYCEVVVSIP